MKEKIKLEWKEFHFKRGLASLICAFPVICYGQFLVFHSVFPKGSLWEYVIYGLDNEYVTLVLAPVFLLVLTSSRRKEVCRYPLLLRYRTRNEFFAIRAGGRVLFAAIFLLLFLGTLWAAGTAVGLPEISEGAYIDSTEFAEIILSMAANLFCYFCFLLLLHELAAVVFQSGLTALILASFLPICNLIPIKLHMMKLVLWTPWGNIAYMLEGRERTGYGFYWWYWLLLLMIVLYIADTVHKGKDYVFEENRKTD